MKRCFQLAEKGSGRVAPNPLVGAVLVYENRIIGEGYHEKFGEAHAEVNCINSVSENDHHLIALSTLYVSLEPCSHHGKTPPCTELIIANKIRKVVIACSDPFEKVNGAGIEILRKAGIEVLTNVCEAEALLLNKRFFTFHKKQRPYIILKFAQSADGKVARHGDHTFISNALSNTLVHKWRSEESAIMIGTNTALVDDPSLTTRHWPGKTAVRIIVDRQLKMKADAVVLKDEHPVIILNAVKQEENGNKLFYKTGESDDMVAVTLQLLHSRNMLSLLVEGGPALLQSFINADLWDEARVITNTGLLIGEGLSAPVLKHAERKESFSLGSDRLDMYINDNHQ